MRPTEAINHSEYVQQNPDQTEPGHTTETVDPTEPKHQTEPGHMTGPERQTEPGHQTEMLHLLQSHEDSGEALLQQVATTKPVQCDCWRSKTTFFYITTLKRMAQ